MTPGLPAIRKISLFHTFQRARIEWVLVDTLRICDSFCGQLCDRSLYFVVFQVDGEIVWCDLTKMCITFIRFSLEVFTRPKCYIAQYHVVLFLGTAMSNLLLQPEPQDPNLYPCHSVTFMPIKNHQVSSHLDSEKLMFSHSPLPPTVHIYLIHIPRPMISDHLTLHIVLP